MVSVVEITVEIAANPDYPHEPLLDKIRQLLKDEGDSILQFSIRERVQNY